jgi:DNA-binding SARP family transcriptional activator
VAGDFGTPVLSEARPVIRLFGPLQIEADGRTLGPRDLGGTRPKQVLELLLVERGRRVPVDRLAERLWPDERPASVGGSLQTFVSVLRRHLTDDRERARALVVTEPEAYRVDTGLIELDLDRFDELLERSAREPTRDARASLEQALALVRGDVLEDEPYATWALDLRGSYQGRVLGVRLEAAEAALAERDLAAALAHSDAAASLDRFSERAHRIAMLALYAQGRQHEALARYRAFRSLLGEELGLEPTVGTRSLESSILRQEDVEDLLPRPIVRATVRAVESPVQFLGRTAELDALRGAVGLALDGRQTLTLVEAESGLGKTRLLDEMASSLDGARVGLASCSELERHLPYVPLATALRQALAGMELDVARMPALAEVLPELDLGPDRRTFEEVEVLEALVTLVAETGPLVLLLDDLQWADTRTLAALGYLRRRAAAHPAALVITARPLEAASDHPLARLEPDTVVRLEPLTEDDLAPLGVDGLHAASGGTPRFVTEMIRCGRRAEPPKGLVEALVAQCRAEGAWGCRVLTAASVLDQPFEPEPLAALLDVDAADLIEELERLCERRILRIDGLRFRFRYDLVRRALRTSVSPARRRLLRARIDRLVVDPHGGREAMGSQTG